MTTALDLLRLLTVEQRYFLGHTDAEQWEVPKGKPPVFETMAPLMPNAASPLYLQVNLNDFPAAIIQRSGRTWALLPLGQEVRTLIQELEE